MLPRRPIPTSRAMCSHGIGVSACTSSHARWAELSGQMAKSAPAAASSRTESSIMRATPGKSPASNDGIHAASGIESIVMRGWSCLPTSASASRQIAW